MTATDLAQDDDYNEQRENRTPDTIGIVDSRSNRARSRDKITERVVQLHKD